MRSTTHRALLSLSALALLAACSDIPEPLAPPQVAASLSNAPTVLGSSVFDLATNPDGSLLAGEIFTGNVVELRKGEMQLAGTGMFAVTGLAPIGRGNTLVLTGGGFGFPAEAETNLDRMSRGGARMVADLGHFEETVNPELGGTPSVSANSVVPPSRLTCMVSPPLRVVGSKPVPPIAPLIVPVWAGRVPVPGVPTSATVARSDPSTTSVT